MRQIDLLQLSEEEKKMNVIDFLTRLKDKEKESIIDFVKNIDGNDIVYHFGTSYYVSHVKSINIKSSTPSFFEDSIMLNDHSVALLDDSTFYVDKLPSFFVLKKGTHKEKYKTLFDDIKNKLLNIINETDLFSSSNEIEISKVYKPNLDSLQVYKYELEDNDKLKDLTMNDILLKEKEKLCKDIKEYNKTIDILKLISDKVLISKDSFEYTFFVPLTVDYTCSLVEGVWFSVSKDLSKIFFEEGELFNDSQTKKKFYIIEDDEENDQLMTDLLKFKNQYHKLLNSIKVSLKEK